MNLGSKSIIINLLLICLTISRILPFPTQKNMEVRDLLNYLRKSMDKAEKLLLSSSGKKNPSLRRRAKNALIRDYDGSPNDYIGKSEASSKDDLTQSSQLDIAEAYGYFVRTHLKVEDESTITPDYVIENKESTEYRMRLYCRKGLFLEILPNGTVRGTQDQHSPYTYLSILMYDVQMVIIRTAQEPYRYLVMTEDSKVSTVRQATIQSIFFYRVGGANKNDYTFQRAYGRNKKWFLALKKRGGGHGTLKKGKNTNSEKKSAHFIAYRH